jgi:hypothetical protein
MITKILESIKDMLGVNKETTNFDQELVVHINSALFSLHQIGVGLTPFSISSDDAEWSTFIDDVSVLGPIQSFVFMKVKLKFDPPTTSFGIEAFKQEIAEVEWRIRVHFEKVEVAESEVSQDGE